MGLSWCLTVVSIYIPGMIDEAVKTFYVFVGRWELLFYKISVSVFVCFSGGFSALLFEMHVCLYL